MSAEDFEKLSLVPKSIPQMYDLHLLSIFLELPPGAVQNFIIRMQRHGCLLNEVVNRDVFMAFVNYRYTLPGCFPKTKMLIEDALGDIHRFVV